MLPWTVRVQNEPVPAPVRLAWWLPLPPLLLSALEASLLWWPDALAQRLAGFFAALRCYADPELAALWQLWSGALLWHDVWHLLIAVPIWLVWWPAIERRLGTGLLVLALVGLVPLAMALLRSVWTLPVAILIDVPSLVAIGIAGGLWPRRLCLLRTIVPRFTLIECRTRLVLVAVLLLLCLVPVLARGLWVVGDGELHTVVLLLTWQGYPLACGVAYGVLAALLQRT